MAPSLDERIVTRQIGRKPKPFLDVCRRCRYEYPQVILNDPVVERTVDRGFGRRTERGVATPGEQARAGDRVRKRDLAPNRDPVWGVFPTMHWLTCPLLHRAISRLEAEGQIGLYEKRLREDPQFMEQMQAEHSGAAAARLAIVPQDVQDALRKSQPRQWHSLAQTGVAGIRAAEGVKCLHAHYADFVGRGTNPIGQEVDEQLRQRGVAVDGDDQCWRRCTVSDEADRGDD